MFYASDFRPLAVKFTFLLLSPLKILVDKFSSAISTQKSKVDELEKDMSNLADDVSSLKDKVDFKIMR